MAGLAEWHLVSVTAWSSISNEAGGSKGAARQRSSNPAFGCLSRYNQLLGELVTNKDAEAYDPLVVRRIRRAKDRRRCAMMGVSPASVRRDR